MSSTGWKSNIEIINPNMKRGGIQHVLFDFDGTISLIREGWQQVMIPMLVRHLKELHTGESDAQLNTIVEEFVAQTTGKQTIYQMIGLAEMVTERGGKAFDPLEYKQEYLDLLWDRIKDRIQDLETGKVQPIERVVKGSYELLELLHARKVRMYVASGTDEPYVKKESALVKVDHYFDGIYGAQDDYKKHSKKIVIERILRENQVPGESLLTFGDGFVEIENTKDVGGIAIGVATDETAGEGIDEWKRDRLIKAGADIIVPEFRDAKILIPYLFGEIDSV
jgi:phosphoglycolate phosphatase-like HAD superfamily hydrolase